MSYRLRLRANAAASVPFVAGATPRPIASCMSRRPNVNEWGLERSREAGDATTAVPDGRSWPAQPAGEPEQARQTSCSLVRREVRRA